MHNTYTAWKYFAAAVYCKYIELQEKITFWLEFTDIWQGFEAGEIIKSAVLKYETTVFLSIEIIRFSIPTPAFKNLLENIKTLQYQYLDASM